MIAALPNSAPFGRYFGDVVAKWLDDGRRMQLCEDLVYVEPDGTVWHVPKGTKIDGASIPWIFWTLIGSPYTGRYRKASVVHDYYCAIRTRPAHQVHAMFLSAMLASQANPWVALAFYLAVCAFGPDWPLDGNDDADRPKPRQRGLIGSIDRA
jgi:hypothetical protein